MKKKLDRNEVLRKLSDLASGRCNDAVRLVMYPPPEEVLDKLDLSQLSEVKRGANGLIEIKLINKVAAFELLMKLSGGEGAENSGSDDFFLALERAADTLGEIEA